MQTELAIAMNPHVEDPSALWDLLQGIEETSGSAPASYLTDANATLDKGSFELGKLLMADNSRIDIR